MDVEFYQKFFLDLLRWSYGFHSFLFICITLIDLRILKNPSVQFIHSVVSNSLWPHQSQHARPPCPSPSPGVHSNSRPSSLWCHPAISSSVVPFSSCPQSLPASGSFPISQLFTWDGQSTGVSALASFLPKKSQGWSLLEWTGWISLQSKGLSRVLQHHSSKASILQHSAFFTVQLSYLYMTTGKTIALTRWTLHPHNKFHMIIVYDPLNILLNLICLYILFYLLVFCWGFLHSCSSVILSCNLHFFEGGHIFV